MGMAPIIDGMGLIITVFSYNGLITLSPTSDVKTMPDLDNFSRYLRESANKLEAALLKKGKTKEKARKKKPAPPKSDKLFLHFKKHLKANAKFIKPNNGLFQFHVKGTVQSDWKINLDKSPAVVTRGVVKNPDVTLTIKETHLMKIGEGKLNLQTAFIQGRVKMEGDTNRAMKLAAILSKIPKMEKK